MAEINRLCNQLIAHAAYREGRQWVIPLHSSVSPQEQRKAFDVPPPGIRKIVVATNIAETSLTISDVSLVVDSGKLKVCLTSLAPRPPPHPRHRDSTSEFAALSFYSQSARLLLPQRV